MLFQQHLLGSSMCLHGCLHFLEMYLYLINIRLEKYLEFLDPYWAKGKIVMKYHPANHNQYHCYPPLYLSYRRIQLYSLVNFLNLLPMMQSQVEGWVECSLLGGNTKLASMKKETQLLRMNA